MPRWRQNARFPALRFHSVREVSSPLALLPRLAASARSDKMAMVSRTKRLIVVVVVVASVLAVTGVLVFLSAPDRSGWSQVGTLSQVRADGLEYFPGPNVFVVAPTRGGPYALSAVSPHLGENP